MEIKPLLRKQYWVRRTPSDYVPTATSISTGFGDFELKPDTFYGLQMQQSDFMNELHPSAHRIHSCSYRSMRPIYEFNIAKSKHEITGFEDVERVDVGLNEATVRHKVTTVAGNDMWFQPEGNDAGNEDRVAAIKSQWVMSGMRSAFISMCRALFATADAAVYLYLDGKTIRYKVFSFEDGDSFNMVKNERNEDVFVRRVNYNGVDTIEIYDSKNVSMWVSSKDDTLIQKVIGKVRGSVIETSTDGYKCIDRRSHGMGRCPVVYFRAKDVVWGNGQKTIERIERLLSDLAENNKYYAYQIMFTTGGIISLPPAHQMGKVISSSDPQGKAEILQPADASNTFTIDLEKNLDLLCESLALVIINPKDLKAGENTGAFIKNLYWREVQWAETLLAEIRPQTQQLLDLFKICVAKAEDDNKISGAKLSWGIIPCVPKNETEEIQNICMSKNAGVTSIETASGEIPFNNPREYEKIQREMALEVAEERKRKAAETQNVINANRLKKDPSETGEGANNQGK